MIDSVCTKTAHQSVTVENYGQMHVCVNSRHMTSSHHSYSVILEWPLREGVLSTENTKKVQHSSKLRKQKGAALQHHFGRFLKRFIRESLKSLKSPSKCKPMWAHLLISIHSSCGRTPSIWPKRTIARDAEVGSWMPLVQTIKDQDSRQTCCVHGFSNCPVRFTLFCSGSANT